MIRRVTGVLVTGILLFLGVSGTAWAHGGPIQLDVRGDGGQNITASVTYVRDGHAVREEVVLTYTAVSTEGRTVGPAPMVASAEGQAFYQSRQPLPLGDWTVTVTAAHPSTATKTINVTSATLPDPTAATTSAPGGIPTAVLIAAPIVIAAAGVAVALFLRRRRLATR